MFLQENYYKKVIFCTFKKNPSHDSVIVETLKFWNFAESVSKLWLFKELFNNHVDKNLIIFDPQTPPRVDNFT